MKENILQMRIAFFIAAVVSLLMTVIFVYDGSTETFEVVVGVTTILVTAILGISTYYQAKEQSQIDMIDKTPCLRVVFRDDDLNDEEQFPLAMQKPEITMLTSNMHYVKVGSIPKNKEENYWSLELKLQNVSNCVINKIGTYFFEGDYRKERQCFEKVTHSPRLKLAYENAEKDADEHQKLMREALLNPTKYVCSVPPTETFDLEYIVEEPIKNYEDGLARYSFAFEMESVYGYTYTQYIYMAICLAAYGKPCCLMAVVDADGEVIPGEIDKKLLRK